jgi:signal transduction histidine kinase
MKTKTVIIIMALMMQTVAAMAVRNDTVWTNYHWNGYNVQILGGDLHYYTRSKIKIEPDKATPKLDVTINKGKVEELGNNWFYFTPMVSGISEILVNDKVFKIAVLPMRDPKYYLDGKKQPLFSSDFPNGKNIINKEELQRSTCLIVKSIDTTFEVESFTITILNGSDLLVFRCKGNRLSPESKIKLKEIKEKGKFWIEDVMLYYPDGLRRLGYAATINVIDNYNDEFIRNTVSYSPNTHDLNLLKTDLRIKIKGNPAPEDIKTITDLAKELNDLLETIKVKIVNNRPNLIIDFDSIKNDSLYKGWQRTSSGYKTEQSSLYFPQYKSFILQVSLNYEKSYRDLSLKQDLINLLGNFAPSKSIGDKDSSIFYNSDHLSEYDKYLLKTLYSNGGEAKVIQLLDANTPSQEDKTGVFILSLVICIVLLFVFYQLYHYYGIEYALDKFRNKWLKRIIESILVAQIPSLTFLLLLLEKFFTGDFHEAGFILYLEIFFVPFSLLVGLLFLLLDTVLNRIKKVWISVLLNLIASFFCLWFAYQLLYLYLMPDFVTLIYLSWKIVLIAFLIVAYRIYSRFQTTKIAGLLQEKELELTRQKELTLQSDLMTLQSRINPHFLYNALNSIASLVYVDAGKTEKMALSLSRLFRYNINKGNELFSTIRDEIEMVELYLSIEKNRFDEKLFYNIEVADSLAQFAVPRFLLQPLVENAVKHGISKLTEQGEIKIKIFENEQKVFIEIYDNGPEFPGGLMSGYGLQNTYEKLKHVYKKPFDIEFVNLPEKKMVITLAKK